MNRMDGKVAIVTGGARGIGRQIVDTFVAEGAKAVISADMAMGKDGPNIKNVILNVTDRDAIAKFVEEIKIEFGHVDVLVNNAGITKDALVQKMQESEWDIVVDVNLKGVFNLTQAVVPMMLEMGKGSIINISSVVGVYGNIGQTNYAATKAGVIGMSHTWSKEFTRKGAAIRTNVIAPGYVATEMMETVPDKVLEPIRQKTPLGRLGTPQEIANAVLFLASDESSFVNGHVLEVTGGLRL